MSGVNATGTPFQPRKGPRTRRRILCGAAQCVTAREAGAAAEALGDLVGARAKSAGVLAIDPKLAGTAICPDCQTSWAVSPS